MTASVKIVRNARVVVPDDPRIAFTADLLIKNDRIAEIGTRGDVLTSLFPTAEVVDATGKIALPGFVDAHFHGESVLRASRMDVASLSTLTKEELSAIYRAAYFSALKSGITTIAEYSLVNADDAVSAIVGAFRRADMRGVVTLHNADQIEAARSLAQRGVGFALAFPSDDDLTTYNLQTTLRSARELHWPIVIHHGETIRSAETIKRNFGKTLMQLLEEYRVLEYRVEVVHCCALDDAGTTLLAKRRLPLVLTPASVMAEKTESPQLQFLMKRNAPIALGTDYSVPDPFESMRALRAVALVQRVSPPTAAVLLDAHTQGAARALGLEREIGAIRVGMKADILFLDATDIRLASLLHTGGNSFLEELVSLASSRDVSDVMINGEFFVRHREVMTFAEEDLMRELGAVREKLLRASGPETETPIRMRVSESLTGVPPRVAESDIEGEEGFQIIRPAPSTNNDESKIIPMPQQADRRVELSKSVKRVFGDDEEN